MPELATAWVSVIADTRQIPGQIRRAFGETDRIAQQQGQRAGRSFSGAFGTSLKAAGAIAGAAGGIAAVGAAMRSSIGAGMDFTGALNTLQAVSGATAQQVAEVGRRARELGTDSQLASTSSIDAANAMLELAKGGFTVEQSMQAARGTLQLAAAAQISAAEAATIQSQALQAFGQDATYAGKTADILANAANASSAEITDVAQALQQSGTVANQFGLSMSDTAASIALLANAGIKGSDAGTLLKSTLLALTDQSDQAETVMKQLGLTVYDSQGRFVGMESLFGQLNAASERMTDQQYQQATAILFGSDAMRLSGLAAQVGADGFSQMRAAMEKSGSAADVAAAKMQGLPGAWEKLKNSAQDAGLAFYDVVEGPLTSAANAAANVLGDLVSDAEDAGKGVRAAFDDSRVQSFLASVRNDGASAFAGITQAATGLAPVIEQNLKSAATIAGALGVSTWTVFLEVVRAATTVIEGLTPVLSTLATFTSNNAGLATAMVGAFLAWKLIPPVMSRVQSALAPVTSGLSNARTAGQNFIQTNTAMSQGLAQNRALLMQMAGVVQTANGRWQTLSGQSLTAAQAMQRMNTVAASGVTTFGRFGSAISQIGSHVPVVTRMQAAFVNTAISANQFGRTLGVAAAASTGLRSAGSAMMGVFGGPLGAAVAGATVYLGLAASAHAENTQKARAQSQAVKDLAASEVALGSALSQSRGAMSQDVWGKAGEQLTAYQQTLKTTADQHKSTWDQLKEIGGIGKILFHTNDELNQTSERAMAAQKAMTDLGMTNEEVARAVYGTEGQWKLVSDRLAGMGEGGVMAAANLAHMRREFEGQQASASRVTPGVTELGDAMRLLGDKSADAADKSRALRAALEALNPARSKGEAIAQHNEIMQRITASTKEAIDRTQGFGKALLDVQFGVNTSTTNGQQLRKSLMDIVDATESAAVKGADMAERNRLNGEALQQLARQYGLTVEQIRGAADQLGLDDIEISVAMKDLTPGGLLHQLTAISTAWRGVPEGQKTVTVDRDQVSDETEAWLNRVGASVKQIPNSKQVTITAKDDDAKAKVLLLTQNLSVLNAMKVDPKLNLETSLFQARNTEAIGALQALDKTFVSGRAGLMIDELLAGKQFSMQELQILSQTTADPAVHLLIDQLLQNATIANKALDDLARKRNAQIQIDFIRGLTAPAPVDNPQQFGANFDRNLQELGRRQQGAYADGGIRTYAEGGIAALARYANGGHLTEPQILPGRGAGSLYTTAMGPAIAAEGETGGEAWIPLGLGKRARSTSILATVADLFGLTLFPKDQLPSNISGLFGALAGGAVKGALKGVDGVRKFADGGILRSLADGVGASRPLTGAPYVWGGTNWGDCSGTMSAFARMAAGLDPFGGRFSTATMGAQIQQMGGQLGRGGSGDMRFGWVNGGPGGGHTAGTLPDGTNVEMGGGNGGGMVGGSAAGADDPQFSEHAFFRVESPYNPGTGVPGDPGGWVQRPDGTWVQNAPTGSFGSSGSTGGSGEDKTLSGRLGNAASAFVSGQITDLFNVLSINDQPGWLAAITEYENQQRQAQSGSGSKGTDPMVKQQYEDAKLKSKQDFENAKLQRKRTHDTALAKLRSELDAKRISEAEYDRRVADLKRKHEDTELAKKQEFDQKTLEAKQKFDQLKTTPNQPNTPGQAPTVRDPGTTRPAPGQDLGRGPTAGLPATGSAIKDAFRSGLREAWRQGPPWDATDWIINKESGWDMNARNGKYFGGGQFSPEVWAAAGKTPTADARTQGEVFDNYVGSPRYGDPLKAKEHHVNAGWYERGGVIHEGANIMLNGLGHKETALPFDPRDLKASLDRGGSSSSEAVVAKLDQLLQVLAHNVRGTTYNVSDDRSLKQAQRSEKQRIATTLAGL
ncbi:phage tail tape measure protein [Gordonia lacunae]|uniref:Phage tail tape measure protein n=1 Tax=Gordonia lacunae TaxID=417102 RepID=A0A243Q9I7_9ACTN|nr:phage tail tape measure protein [Gordonia lacunae]OUC77288.1 phage tail tape measure protein [Gordonia lacunae]